MEKANLFLGTKSAPLPTFGQPQENTLPTWRMKGKKKTGKFSFSSKITSQWLKRKRSIVKNAPVQIKGLDHKKIAYKIKTYLKQTFVNFSNYSSFGPISWQETRFEKNLIRSFFLFLLTHDRARSKKLLIGHMNSLVFDLLSVHSWAVLLQSTKCYYYLRIKVFFYWRGTVLLIEKFDWLIVCEQFCWPTWQLEFFSS